jgi:ribosomal-protein-alanine N-acetyltransferase
MDVVIAIMGENDIGKAIAMEQRATQYSWTVRALGDCIVAGCDARKITSDSFILGYCLSRIVGDDVEVLNIAVDPANQCHGLATRLLDELIKDATNKDATNKEATNGRVRAVFVEVRRSNTPARQLYSKLGFVEVGVRRNYYEGVSGKEDALVLRRSLCAAGCSI